MEIFAVLAIVFFGLWLSAKSKFNKLSKQISDIDGYREKSKLESDHYYEQKKKLSDEYLRDKKAEADKYAVQKHAELADVNSSIEKLTKAKSSLSKVVKDLELQVFMGSVRVDAYENFKSDELKNQIALLQGKQESLIKTDEALDISSSALELKKTVLNNQKKQILRCFNAEVSGLIEGVTAKNVDTVRAKIQRAYDAVNKMFAIDGVQITPEYLSLKFEELSMVYAYMIKLEEEKELKKAIREQIVEEEKVRREIERAKQKIEKEEAQYRNEINKLMLYMQKAKDEVQAQLYMDKIAELDEKLKEVEADKENVLQREQNTRAGFVYIISNIGSFGERVFKIGMTRRLEPMDRIAELSSASVPFPFDVHAMIFSDDAPGLETVLHNHFDSERVNKINRRKEFFNVDLEEIKKVVKENHNATTHFVDIPEAMEYRETLKVLQQQEAAA